MRIESNIADINKVLIEYQRLSGLSDEDVLSKQGGKLAFTVYKALFATKKPAGGIRAQIEARLKAGKMIHIRDSVRQFVAGKIGARAMAGRKNIISGKGLSVQQQLVEREINVRESGRGVLAQSARYKSVLTDEAKAISRGGSIMSEVGLKIGKDKGYVKIDWAGVNALSSRVASGLEGKVPTEAIKEAIDFVHDDILVYVRRKQSETVAATVKAMVGPMKTLAGAIT